MNTIERRSISGHIERLNAHEVVLNASRKWATVEWDGKHYVFPANVFSVAKLKARIAVYRVKQRIRNQLLERLLTRIIQKLDTHGEKWLRRAVKGDTFLGKVIFGLLDVSAIPNFHEILKAVNKQYPDATPAEKAKLVVQKVDWTRTLVGVVFAIALAMGWADPETIKALL